MAQWKKNVYQHNSDTYSLCLTFPIEFKSQFYLIHSYRWFKNVLKVSLLKKKKSPVHEHEILSNSLCSRQISKILLNCEFCDFTTNSTLGHLICLWNQFYVVCDRKQMSDTYFTLISSVILDGMLLLLHWFLYIIFGSLPFTLTSY